MRGGHLGHVTPEQIVVASSNECYQCNMAFICQAVKKKLIFENDYHINVYSPEPGADNSLES